jgi:alanine-synthesizing transaminase
MWVLLQPRRRRARAQSPSYPIHIWGPLFAGADIREVPMATDDRLLREPAGGLEYSWPKPRVIVLSFPHNPTTPASTSTSCQRVVDFARERDVIVVHDNAYADLGFDGYEPPSILQAEGAKECAVELYSMTKSFSMAGWRVAFLVGNPEVVAALAKLKSYLDYGTFQPIQIAATVTLNEAPTTRARCNEIYQAAATRSATASNRIGWEIPRPRARCSPGRRSPSPTARWARSSSPRCSCARPTWRPRRASASVPAARATCASPSSRTSSASRRPPQAGPDQALTELCMLPAFVRRVVRPT